MLKKYTCSLETTSDSSYILVAAHHYECVPIDSTITNDFQACSLRE